MGPTGVSGQPVVENDVRSLREGVVKSMMQRAKPGRAYKSTALAGRAGMKKPDQVRLSGTAGRQMEGGFGQEPVARCGKRNTIRLEEEGRPVVLTLSQSWPQSRQVKAVRPTRTRRTSFLSESQRGQQSENFSEQ